MYKKALQNINKFYECGIKTSARAAQIPAILKEAVDFEKYAVFYLVPNVLNLEFSFGGEFKSSLKIDNRLTEILYDINITDFQKYLKNLSPDGGYLTASRLTVNGIVFGILCIVRNTEDFSAEEKIIFQTYSNIIAGIIKDIELSNILSNQVRTMEKSLKDIHAAYETIKKQNKKIKENEKLQNEFTANISHDLRTPLNSIICLSEILAGGMFGKLNKKQSEYIEDIRISGIRLLGMINEVLDIAKLESHTVKLNLSEVNSEMLINEVCNILKPLYEKKNIEICKKIQPFKLTADYTKLQQVMFNILGNAIKFSHTASKINIEASEHKNYIEISVEDFGTGIDKKDLKNIFKKFYQAGNHLSETEKSTGLGLAAAKEFVKLHGGKIEVKSELNKGSKFIIKLPAA